MNEKPQHSPGANGLDLEAIALYGFVNYSAAVPSHLHGPSLQAIYSGRKDGLTADEFVRELKLTDARAEDFRQAIRRAEKKKNRTTAPVSPAEPHPPSSDLAFVRAADVKLEQIDWLWEGRQARGKITVLAGDPGVGKTTLALNLAACVSTGTPLPGQSHRTSPAQNVIILSSEDGLGDTLRPRLEAAGADLSRVYLEDAGELDALRFMLPRDVPLLEAKITELRAGLVIIDPIMSYLDPEVDSHKDQEVRSALLPLVALAKRTRVAVQLLMHLNKATGMAALYRGGGSIAFAGVARIVLLAAKDPDAPESCVLARTKGNLGRPPRALCYSIGSGSNGAAEVRWNGESEHTSETLLAPPKRGPEPDALEQAMAFVRDHLAAGPKSRGDVIESAAKVGISERTIGRAAKFLDLRSLPQGKERLWSLP